MKIFILIWILQIHIQEKRLDPSPDPNTGGTSNCMDLDPHNKNGKKQCFKEYRISLKNPWRQLKRILKMRHCRDSFSPKPGLNCGNAKLTAEGGEYGRHLLAARNSA